MVNTISGSGLGLFNTRDAGVGGSGSLGQGKEGIAVNATTGNVVLQRQDQILIGQGLDANLVRTYNSLAKMTGTSNDLDNNDGFRFNFAQQIKGLMGTVNTAGSTVIRVNGDGNETVFTYDTTLGKYIATDGSGAHDTLSYSGGTNGTWTYTEGSSQLKETYDWLGATPTTGKLLTRLDAENKGITGISYNGNGTVNQITDSSGQTLTFAYSGTNVSSISTSSNGTTLNHVVRYGYDGSNRLTSVTLDLSPVDESIGDGYVYTTTYTYVGSTNLIASITQSDGTVASFVYERIKRCRRN